MQTKENLGLIKRHYPTDAKCDGKQPWARFECYVDHLNKQAPSNVQYKVLIMGRHGEGWHNVAESTYGTELWDVSFRVSTLVPIPIISLVNRPLILFSATGLVKTVMAT
jgi:hypothetical protein